MKRILLTILTIHYTLFTIHCKAQETLTDYVNPFIGTGGHGHTYPGAVLPFGMVQLSPDTRLDGWDGCSGYYYTDSVIYGFSHTHLSGTGCSDFGDILLMPTVGDVVFNNGSDGKKGYATHFSKKNEKAKAGNYQVKLDDGISIELTATKRAGMHRYIYPKTNKANIIIDLEHRDEVLESSIKIINDHEIEGLRRSKAWAKDQYVYFVAQFSKPFINHIIHTKDKGDYNAITELNWKNIKAALIFNHQDTIVVRVGISAVSCEGARKNLEAEIKTFDFDYYKQEATKAWEKELSKIVVKSKDKEKKTIFYTSLYHCMLAPNLYSDFDGNYRGMDMKIHHSDHDVYNVFSLWDTYRAEHPLFTIIEQKRTSDFINTFLKCYDESGRLPVWELAANETDCMIGYHSIPVIVDAFQKGIKDFDLEKTLYAFVRTSNEKSSGLDAYRKEGYIPSDKASESVSKTLEYAYDDWCIAQFVKLMGNQTYYDSYYKQYLYRAQYWKNLFDPTTDFFRAKKNGSFKAPFDPCEVNFDFTEANTWQYNFYVPQDVSGLMNAMGGKEKFTSKLGELFKTKSKTTGRDEVDITGMIGQYAHGNEPSHHIAYLYDYAGQSWKTQEKVHQIMTTLYSNNPDGLCGNEDCGQMSAWYVLSAMGFYPVCPGSGDYAIGTPSFDTVIINLENGKQFMISANNLSNKNFYIQSSSLNNSSYKKNYLNHTTLMNGGTLQFTMNNISTKNSATDSIISTSINEYPIVPVPFIESIPKAFTDSLIFKVGDMDPNAQMLVYKYHGHYPIEEVDNTYRKPIIIKESGQVEVFAVKGDSARSFSVFANYIKLDKDIKIKIISPYSSQYAGDGPNTLIDNIRGGTDFKTGEWLGFEGTDFEAIVDLGEIKKIRRVGAGCLQDIGSWIWMPKEITFMTSADGNNFEKISTIKTEFSDTISKPSIKDFYSNINDTSARFIKVIAKNYGTIPDWHPGKGGKSWLFLDEIMIE